MGHSQELQGLGPGSQRSYYHPEAEREGPGCSPQRPSRPTRVHGCERLSPCWAAGPQGVQARGSRRGFRNSCQGSG